MNARILLRKDRVYADGKCPFAICVTLGKGKRVVLGLGGVSARPRDIDGKGFVRGRDQLVLVASPWVGRARSGFGSH